MVYSEIIGYIKDMKKIHLLFWISLLFLGSCQTDTSSSSASSPPSDSTEQKSYGVFVGIGPANINKLFNYRMVIIDAALFTSEQIKTLRDKGITVYSYLNAGAIEKSREYKDADGTDRRNEFWEKTLKAYAGWPDEKWMDVSYTPWQDFLANIQGKSLAEKGIDGFFLDNLDVYDEIKQDENLKSRAEGIYNGLVATLGKLSAAHSLPMIINGGDTFVKRALTDKKLNSRVKGVNQECVFTTITSYNGSGSFGIQKETDRKYIENNLAAYKNAGLQVYLTEYAKTSSGPEIDKIANYCKENNFLFFIATSLKLDED